MSRVFFKNILRNLIVIVLLLQPHALSNAGTLCSETHCVYLPITSNPSPPVAISLVKFRSKIYERSLTGEIINISDYTIYNVQIQATFGIYNPFTGVYEGSHTDIIPTVLTATLPGQTNVFFYLTGSKSTWILSTTKVVSWDIASTSSFTNLAITASHIYTFPFDYVDGQYVIYSIVTGTLRNDTGNTIKNVQVYAWNVEKTVGGRQTISQVAPGATVAFSTTLAEELTPTDTIRIVAQGIVSP